MTEDQILAEAQRITARRLNEKRLLSFHDRDTVTIRWDVPGAPFGESYTGIRVPRSMVEDVVAAHFGPLVAKP